MSSSKHFQSYLVSPEELNEKLSDKSIIPLCVSWFLPNDPQKRTGLQVFKEEHLPRARFMDIDQVKDHSSPYPHMLPSANVFAKAMSQLGIKNSDTVVVYDTKELGIFSAPRGAWMLKIFGHENVHILNNFKTWTQKGLPSEAGEPQAFPETKYEASTGNAEGVVAFGEIEAIAKGKPSERLAKATLLDARPSARWAGAAPEPREGLSSGHVPGSLSVPFSDVLNQDDKTFLSQPQLVEVFRSRGVDLSKPIISSCGTGVTAAVVDAALSQVSGTSSQPRYLYDGSWTEYAQRVDPSLIQKS